MRRWPSTINSRTSSRCASGTVRPRRGKRARVSARLKHSSTKRLPAAGECGLKQSRARARIGQRGFRPAQLSHPASAVSRPRGRQFSLPSWRLSPPRSSARRAARRGCGPSSPDRASGRWLVRQFLLRSASRYPQLAQPPQGLSTFVLKPQERLGGVDDADTLVTQ
jgi:hypothetical protein